jgi:RNA polymerase sigma-70 factor (ECF subfamily)
LSEGESSLGTFIKVTSATAAPAAGLERVERLDVAKVHAAHADFVWRSLARLGVRQEDLSDMLQEVFVVVHRRADSYDGTGKVTSWLFGICLRVASGYRRSLGRRREQALDAPDGRRTAEHDDPEARLDAKRARALLTRVLDAMPLDKRAIFAMFEIDGLSCGEIAEQLDVPVGTVHSRLHAARAAFAKSLQRERARSQRGGPRSESGRGPTHEDPS